LTSTSLGIPVRPAEAELESARRRARLVLVAGAALGSTATVIANTVTVIAADRMLEGTTLVGAAVSAGIVGAAVGTTLLASVMARRGRRVGLSLGYGFGLLGGLIAAFAVMNDEFLWLLLGMTLIGMTNSATQLSRYASAEMAPPELRASAIGIVVWAATAGAILGPVLLPATAALAETAGLADTVGPFVATALAAGAAGLTLTWKLRPDPDDLAVPGEGIPAESEVGAIGPPGLAMREILRRPAVTVALVTMIVGQIVMVVIMAMTPVHMSEHGHDLSAVGVVISAHVLGMFALSPLSGRISDLVGPITTILLGSAVLATAGVLAALAPPDGGMVLLVALFLLGYGWNLGFVAGSSLLTSGLEAWERTRAQGYADSLVWGSSALASLAAGFVLTAAGYAALGILGATLLILPVAAVIGLRTRIAPARTTG
jgi:MFS family permease